MPCIHSHAINVIMDLVPFFPLMWFTSTMLLQKNEIKQVQGKLHISSDQKKQ